MDYTQSKVYGGSTSEMQDKFRQSLDETEIKRKHTSPSGSLFPVKHQTNNLSLARFLVYDIGMKSANALKRWIGSDHESDLLRRSEALTRSLRRR